MYSWGQSGDSGSHLNRLKDLQPTGIEGLDKLLGGGVPRGSIILVAGNPGTGKTTFGAKFLYEGAARYGEPGIYVSFVEPKSDFYNYMSRLAMDFEELEKRGLFDFMEALTIVDINALGEMLEEILSRIERIKAKRLVIDSISAILQMLGKQQQVRELLHNFFVHGVKRLGVTTLLIAELPIGAQTVGHGIEEFIVDGVIILKMKLVKGRIIRLMELRKLRGAPLTLAELSFRIAPGVGIDLRVPPRPEEIPAHAGEEKVVVAMPGKEGFVDQQLPRGAQILLVVHPLLDSLQVVSWMLSSFLVRNRPGLRILYRSYINSPEAIQDRFMQCYGKAGLKLELGKNFFVSSTNPTLYSVTDIAAMNIYEDAKIRPDVLVIEGLDLILELLADPETYRREHFNNILMRRKYRITSFYTFSSAIVKPSDIYKIPLITSYDAVLYIRPRRLRGPTGVKVYVEVLPLKHALGPRGEACRVDAKLVEECVCDRVGETCEPIPFPVKQRSIYFST